MELIIRRDLISRRLPCRLSESENIAKCREQAGALEEQKEAEQRLETVKSRAKESKDALGIQEGRVAVIGKVITSNTETRDVDCAVIIDYVEKRVLTRRSDTGQIVSVRNMNDEELQMEVYPDGEEADPVTIAEIVKEYFSNRTGADDE